MEKEFNYVYITTNLINGKQYVGDHSTNKLDDGYLGSGKLIKYAIKLYSKNNFKREILEFYNTKEQSFDSQAHYITKFNTLVPYGYNLSPLGGLGVRNSYTHSAKTRLKLSISNKGKHRSPLTEEHKLKLSIIGKGRKQSSEHIIKRAASRKGKLFSDESKKRKSDSMKGKIPWNKGKKMSIEFSQKLSISRKDKKLTKPRKAYSDQARLNMSTGQKLRFSKNK